MALGRDASMGPRPLGRGWMAMKERKPRSRPASMGPRPLGRGWPVANGPHQGSRLGFNGAATARSRMGGRSAPS